MKISRNDLLELIAHRVTQLRILSSDERNTVEEKRLLDDLGFAVDVLRIGCPLVIVTEAKE